MLTSIKGLFVCVLLLLAVACGADADNSAATRDSLQLMETKSAPEKVVLKGVQIDSKSLTAAAAALTDSELNLLSIRSIDSAYADAGGGFKYCVVDSLYAGSSVKVLLIYRQYSEENIAWAAIYDQNYRLLDQLQVYYDNSEGNLMVTSSIINNVIKVQTDNIYSETPEAGKQTQTYVVNESYKFTRK